MNSVSIQYFIRDLSMVRWISGLAASGMYLRLPANPPVGLKQSPPAVDAADG
jgi:hypothetical protein